MVRDRQRDRDLPVPLRRIANDVPSFQPEPCSAPQFVAAQRRHRFPTGEHACLVGRAHRDRPGRPVAEVALGNDLQRCEISQVTAPVDPFVGSVVAGGELAVDLGPDRVQVRRGDLAPPFVVVQVREEDRAALGVPAVLA
ncbi:hypothetical protein [Kribbella amoyensis]|uniref:hypothetical protein n=1 Tax=Kribbella amoyensis TaxID=996641 RepID=UPI001EE18D99|nr:hypothetical protein [Kribbella amoyensis]